MKQLAVTLIATLCAAAFSVSIGAASADLQYVVIVSRHGVRAPTWTAERLNQYSAERWPDFGVPPADLTPRGLALMKLMGGYYGEWLRAEGAVKREGCADASRIYIWADVDQRTRETGRALSESMLPGCSIGVHALDGGDDPLFDPIAAGVATPDLAIAQQSVLTQLGAQPDAFLASHRAAFSMLDGILTGPGTAKERPFQSPSTVGVAIDGNFIDITGPLRTASTLTENLLLEYTNGLSGKELGWGRLNPGNLRQVLELHTTYADLMRRTPYLARARGSNLLAHVLDSMEQAATGRAVPGALGKSGDAALFVVGHDTNLSNISGMLDLSWTIPDYPADDTPPGGALIFLLWRDSTDGHLFVTMKYLVQTLDQMHKAERLTIQEPPAQRDLAIPGCATSQADCSWDAFKRLVREAIDPSFVR